MPGHVFLLHGDLKQLSCDAWLVPSGDRPGPGFHWRDAVPLDGPPGTPTCWGQTRSSVLRWEPREPGWPRPWVVLTINDPFGPVEPFITPAHEFLAVAHAALGSEPRNGRALPLLALPVVGAGYGGGAERAGEIVRKLLPVLYEFVERHPVDIALVMKDPAQYAAAQAVRTDLMGERAWPELDRHLQQRVDILAGRALSGELVLFMGAGVSQAAGLPSWGGLLKRLAGAELAQDPHFADLGPLDQARLIKRRLSPDRELGHTVAEHVRSDHYSLAHGLLAALPVREVVTTNYDTLFEAASRAIGKPAAVLPYDPADSSQRWLLKLHGCISRPNDIVLTREDYLRYDVGRAALAGLVQGLLITRHMLFVGFSLGDDNFHRIADEVRRAVRREPFGTSLSVARNPLLRELWARDLDWVELGDLPRSARLLEIFLDRLAARTVATSDHLFDPRYEATLSEAEVRLRAELDRLHALLSETPREDRRSAAWLEVETLLARLGRGGRSGHER